LLEVLLVLLKKPIQGAKQEGAIGFMKGMGKGLVGLAVKPSVGVLGFVKKSSEGIANTTAYLEREKRITKRFPRYFDERRLVLPYDEEKAYGQYLLQKINKGEFKNQFYYYHAWLEVDEKKCLVLITTSTFYFLSKQIKVLNKGSYQIRFSFLLLNYKKSWTDRQSLFIEVFENSNITYLISSTDQQTVLKNIHVHLRDATDLLSSGSRVNITRSVDNESSLIEPKIKKSGTLRIEGKRYKCLVAKGVFYYSRHGKKHVLSLDGCVCFVPEKHDLHHPFAIIPYKDDPICIDVSSEKEKQEWIDACIANGAHPSDRN